MDVTTVREHGKNKRLSSLSKVVHKYASEFGLNLENSAQVNTNATKSKEKGTKYEKWRPKVNKRMPDPKACA